jgi:hypothetical protein
VTSQWWADDDGLFAALGSALKTAQDMPRDFVDAGKAAFAWHNIDAELAALTYDSAHQKEALATTRAEQAPLRALTFASADWTIELEITDDALCGQIVPPEPGRVELRMVGGEVVTATIDEVGYFVIRPIPSGSFRLHCQLSGGANVLTGWIDL